MVSCVRIYALIYWIAIGKITRNLSLAKYKKEHSQKRNIEKYTLVLEELEECISSASNVEDSIIEQELVAILNNFLETLPVPN